MGLLKARRRWMSLVVKYPMTFDFSALCWGLNCGQGKHSWLDIGAVFTVDSWKVRDAGKVFPSRSSQNVILQDPLPRPDSRRRIAFALYAAVAELAVTEAVNVVNERLAGTLYTPHSLALASPGANSHSLRRLRNSIRWILDLGFTRRFCV